MSDKIYFNTSGKFSFKKSMVSISTKLHHRIAPKHAEKTAQKLLLTPVRLKPKNPEPVGLIKRTVQSSEGELRTYQLGSGPVWVLTHGWSGSANQFFPLMQHIAQQGYTALAYDHPAHGNSGGQIGHIPAFVNGLNAVLDELTSIAGLVGHSMGTAAAIESRHPKLAGKPFLLIAPVLNYLDNLLGSVRRSGFSMRLFDAVVSKIETQYRYPLSSIDPYQKLRKRSACTVIVHDPKDKFAAFGESARAAKEIANVTLVETQGQGHGRIMKCTDTMDAFSRLSDGGILSR